MKVLVQYWKYRDGWTITPIILRKFNPDLPEMEFDPNTVGWFCWVFTDDPDKFEQWMRDNMTGNYDITWRFNSGNPMYTVNIQSDSDASLFKLRWNA